MKLESIRLFCGCCLLLSATLLQGAIADVSTEEPQDQPSTDQAAFNYFKGMAEAGDPVGQFYLGAMYAEGKGVMQYHKKAVELYKKSAQQNYVPAQFRLGMAYASGQGITRDYAMAAKWLERAAKQDHAEAQYNLAGLYYYGLGVRKDHRKAQKLFMSSADLGYAQAQRAIAIFAELERSVQAPLAFPTTTEHSPISSPTTIE